MTITELEKRHQPEPPDRHEPTEHRRLQESYVVVAMFVPHRAPLIPPIQEILGNGATTNAAPNGTWFIEVQDAANIMEPVARAAFSMTDGNVLAERLSVDEGYQDCGLDSEMTGLAAKLWQ